MRNWFLIILLTGFMPLFNQGSRAGCTASEARIFQPDTEAGHAFISVRNQAGKQTISSTPVMRGADRRSDLHLPFSATRLLARQGAGSPVCDNLPEPGGLAGQHPWIGNRPEVSAPSPASIRTCAREYHAHLDYLFPFYHFW